jgi:small subunit ribosomal protein S4
MGQPKKQRRTYDRPQSLWKEDRLEEDSNLVRKYGLRNNKELWKAKSEVARIRSLTRNLLAFPDKKTEEDLLNKLKRLGLLGKEDKLEDVLKVTIDGLLERRLQTQLYRKNIAHSIKQARQFIVHRHVSVMGKRTTVPGRALTLEESENITVYTGSALTDPDHPARKIEKKAVPEEAEGAKSQEEETPVKASTKAEETKEENVSETQNKTPEAKDTPPETQNKTPEAKDTPPETQNKTPETVENAKED